MRISLLGIVFLLGFQPVSAQSLDLPVRGYGLSIGNSKTFTGIRLNFRDREVERITGVNMTAWTPHNPATGTVTGLALGLPAAGAGRFNGVALGVLGFGAEERFSGIGIGGLGIGGGERVEGILIGGLGAGAGGDLVGLGIGGLGIGAGENVTGIMIGGLGAGAGENITGLGIGGLGIGAGENVTGIMIGGLGVGAGGTLTGLAIGGLGVGAPSVRGVMLSGLAAGGMDVQGLIIAPVYMRVGGSDQDDGYFKGVSVSGFNRIQGTQQGVTIGLLNTARSLDGVQIGLLNYAGNKARFRWLPFVNWHFE